MKLNILLLFIALIMLDACHESGEEAKKPIAKEQQSLSVMKLYKGSISSTVQLPGVMQPFEIVPLFPRVNGFVKRVLVDRGSKVSSGQLLVVLDAPEIEEQAAAARLKYAQARSSFFTSKDRYLRLQETSNTPGAVSPFDLSSAKDKMDADSAMVAGEYAAFLAEQTIKGYLSVSAPFAGIITERNVHPGALVGPSIRDAKPMLILQQLTKLRLSVDVPEQYAPQVSVGDTVHYKVNSLPGQEFKGIIARSSQSLNNSYRSETIEMDIENTKEVFKPGMYAEVILAVSGSRNAFTVPKSAVITSTERKFIILANGRIAHWCDISEGNEKGDSVEIFGDLQVGDEILTKASQQIRDGQVVR